MQLILTKEIVVASVMQKNKAEKYTCTSYLHLVINLFFSKSTIHITT